MLPITLYYNYILNIYFPAMTLDNLLGHSSFLICKLEIMQGIKKLSYIAQIYFNNVC